MKKLNLIRVILYFLLISCIPGNNKFYIMNESDNDIFLITIPSIELRLNLKEENEKLYDSVVAMKQNNSSDLGIYKIKPQSKLFLYKIIGSKTSKLFPYKQVKIIKANDTIKLDKINLKQKITKKVNNNYYIEIK